MIKGLDYLPCNRGGNNKFIFGAIGTSSEAGSGDSFQAVVVDA